MVLGIKECLNPKRQTIRAFSRILDALGYELQIVKKKSV